ncbi:MAG: N-acetylmuramoyl-L-alanine amidase [Bacteroidaceae bacterium]|nr:N-acetylmuramoyl-L-alanine amidase [Bacteroidaceae bacterium]
MSRKISYIFVHCTAGPQEATPADLMAEFRSKGWKAPGYHYLITADGTVHQMLAETAVANGVKGYNSRSLHVAYTGGLHLEDNRTPAQKCAIRQLLIKLRSRYPDARILGHRDISPDRNGNGRVDAWERIKACPCFDAEVEYSDI